MRNSTGQFVKGYSSLTRKHGHASYIRSRAYNCWSSMHQRCSNPRNPYYKNYGARGITVCERWLDFSNFLADMGEPSGKLWLDRIDNDKSYSPENCRWATPSEQLRNTRRNHYVEFNGQRKIVTEWAEEYGISKGALLMRIRSGWPIEKALTEPVKLTQKTGRVYFRG